MRRTLTVLTGLALVGLGAIAPLSSPASAADRTLSAPGGPGQRSVTYTGTIPAGTQEEAIGTGQLGADEPLGVCDPKNPTFNDQKTVQVNVPKNLASRYEVVGLFKIAWETQSGAVQDEKLVVIGPDGKVAGASDGSQSQELVVVKALTSGLYRVIACPYNNPAPLAYKATITASVSKPAYAAAPTSGQIPAYREYVSPKGIGDDAGEPSIGNNWKTGATMFQAGIETLKVSFNDKAKTAKWVDTAPAETGTIRLDPILFTDNAAGRTLVSQLYLACSLSAFTDNDGKSWTPSQGCGFINGVDHQTYGGGPFPRESVGALPSSTYKNAVYYCAQGLYFATCAVSRDGGLSFGPGVVTYTSECGGLHGHIRVSPDGSAYLPNNDCGGKQGFAVSEDAGLTWDVRTVPGSITGNSDPSVAAGKDGTVYFGFADGTGHPKIAVSRDKGRTWTKPADVGAKFGIKNTEFSEVIAGDGDRASFAFLGTKTTGNQQAADFGWSADKGSYIGAEWHMYVATTYDRGRTWTTVDATPHNPVQRGCIWNGGGSNICRNLLDFNDITLDKTGRVMVGYADGCTGLRSDCPITKEKSDNKHESQSAILRQTAGKGLFAKYDGALPAGAKVKALRAARGGTEPTSSGTSGTPGGLATTGLSTWVGAMGLLLVLLGLAPRRRRARST